MRSALKRTQELARGVTLSLCLVATNGFASEQETSSTTKDFYKLHSPYSPGNYQAWRRIHSHSSHDDAAERQALVLAAATTPKSLPAERKKVDNSLDALANLSAPSETPKSKGNWRFWKKGPQKESPSQPSVTQATATKTVAATNFEPEQAKPPENVIQPVAAVELATSADTENEGSASHVFTPVESVTSPAKAPPPSASIATNPSAWEPSTPAKVSIPKGTTPLKPAPAKVTPAPSVAAPGTTTVNVPAPMSVPTTSSTVPTSFKPASNTGSKSAEPIVTSKSEPIVVSESAPIPQSTEAKYRTKWK